MAEAMLGEALKDPRLSAEDRQRAETLLAEVRSRGQRSQFSGSLLAGIRRDSNATYRTDAPQVYAAGALVPVPPAFAPDSDTALVVGARVNHQYDLELGRHAYIASSLGVTVVDQRGSSGSQLLAGVNRPYDLGAIDFNTGVLFTPVVGNDAVTLRPHVLASQVWAQQHRYLSAAGLGLDLNWRIDDNTFLDSTLDWQDRSYETRVDLPTAAQLEGNLLSLRARVTRDLGRGHLLSGEVAARRNNAQAGFQDYDSWEARVAYTLSYAGPFANAAGNWSTTLSAGALRRSYGAADPAVIAGTARRDNEWRFGVQQAVPLAPRWLALFSLEHSRNNANLPNYDYRNTSVSASVLRTF